MEAEQLALAPRKHVEDYLMGFVTYLVGKIGVRLAPLLQVLGQHIQRWCMATLDLNLVCAENRDKHMVRRLHQQFSGLGQ